MQPMFHISRMLLIWIHEFMHSISVQWYNAEFSSGILQNIKQTVNENMLVYNENEGNNVLLYNKKNSKEDLLHFEKKTLALE